MAVSSSIFLIFLSSFLSIMSSSSVAKTPYKSLILKVTKDANTLQYVTQVSQRTPLVPLKLTINLGGEFMWVSCFQLIEFGMYKSVYVSSTYHPIPCGSASCKILNTTVCSSDVPGIDYFDNACGHYTNNPVAHATDFGVLGADVFQTQSTDGVATTVPMLYFLCGKHELLEGLATRVVGIAGLGRTNASLPSQLSSYFGFEKRFALCLSSSTRSSGVVFFGNAPYAFPREDGVSLALTYVPLIMNPITEFDYVKYYMPRSDQSPNYFIGVKSIKINGKNVNFDKSLLSINDTGYGGTRISTIYPYTVMESSIYNAVVDAFLKALPKKVKLVLNVKPFKACFSSKHIHGTRMGPAVPYIDLVLQNTSVNRRIFGANSMVKARKGVYCLGILEAPSDYPPRASIVIGGHQIEDNLLEFDLSSSRLGFSTSLLGRSTTCANFNFTSTA